VSVLAAVEAAMAFRSDSSGTGPIPARILMAEARNERARMTVYLNSISGARETETADGDDPTDSIDIEAFSADVFFTVLPLDEEPPEVIE
jgi:hypothetical protein